MTFAEVARWLIAEHHLTVSQIADLTDQQIEELYLPRPEKKAEAKEKKAEAKQTPYERYRNVWLRRGRSLAEIDKAWAEKERSRRKK